MPGKWNKIERNKKVLLDLPTIYIISLQGLVLLSSICQEDLNLLSFC
jgi:hypothetical protein